MAEHVILVDIIDESVPADNHINIAIINQPNRCYGYSINAKTLWKLIQLARYYIYESGTNKIINGDNYYDYFPEEKGGGGGVTPEQVQSMIDASVDPLDERVNKVEDEIDHINNGIVVYEKGLEIAVGKIAYITPGQLYQATTTFTSNNDPSLTVEESMQYDITHGNLSPVTDAEIGDLGDRVDALEEWKPTVDSDIVDLKQAVIDAEEMEYYDTYDEFPVEGNDSITYVDRSTGKTYIWNSTKEEYELMNTNNIIDGTIFNSIL